MLFLDFPEQRGKERGTRKPDICGNQLFKITVPSLSETCPWKIKIDLTGHTTKVPPAGREVIFKNSAIESVRTTGGKSLLRTQVGFQKMPSRILKY